MPDQGLKATSRIQTGELPVGDLPPLQGAERREAARRGKRRWSRHWLLPVSLGLAIVYWIYLYRTVAREATVEVSIRLQQPAADLTPKALYLRPPTDEYSITQVFDAESNKVIDLRQEPITFFIVAPGPYLANVGAVLRLVVDIPPPPQATGSTALPAFYDYDFTASDVKDTNNGQLTPFIRWMKPTRLRVRVELSTTLPFEVTAKRVRIRYPSGDWQKRAFTDSLTFKPSSVDLVGPKVELDQLHDKEIFSMDLEQELPKLEGRADQALATVELRLLSNLQEKGIKARQTVTASIRIAPRPAVLKDYRVPVHADWLGSPLREADFVVDSEVAVEITSYNAELTRLLSADRARGERWVHDNLRALVSLSRLDPALDFTTPDFQAHLDPDWWCKDRNYVLDRDLVVVKKSLIAVKRRAL